MLPSHAPIEGVADPPFSPTVSGANLMTTHSRNATSTVRKPTAAVSARARAREAAKEKKEEEKLQRKEEVRRLKALKRKEVEAKLLQLVEAAGEGTQGLDEIDLEGEWDPEEHDRRMAKVYGEEYGEGEVSTRSAFVRCSWC